MGKGFTGEDALPPAPKSNPTLYPKRNSLSGELDAIPPDMGPRLGKSRSVGFSIDNDEREQSKRPGSESGSISDSGADSGAGSGSLTSSFTKTKSIMMKSFSFKRTPSDTDSRDKKRNLNSTGSFSSSIDENEPFDDDGEDFHRTQSAVNVNLPHLSRSPSLHRRLWGQDVQSRDTIVSPSDTDLNKYVMSPDGIFRRRWNIVAMLFILYTSIEVR